MSDRAHCELVLVQFAAGPTMGLVRSRRWAALLLAMLLVLSIVTTPWAQPDGEIAASSKKKSKKKPTQTTTTPAKTKLRLIFSKDSWDQYRYAAHSCALSVQQSVSSHVCRPSRQLSCPRGHASRYRFVSRPRRLHE